MSDPNETWNPEDGPPPTEEELAESRRLAERLAVHAAPPPKALDADPDLDALVSVALRVRATAHPDRDKTRAVTHSAVQHAVESAGARWWRSRRTWIAAAAALLLGVSGTQWLLNQPVGDDGTPISHPATDVFQSAIGEDARSEPIGRITDSRMSAYRSALLGGNARRQR